MEKKIKELLMSTNRTGIGVLINELSNIGFFKAPCSTQYHLCKPGGLMEHSLNVYNALVELNDALDARLPKDSMIIAALLHDIGKCGQFGKAYYVPNMVRSKTKNKLTGEYDIVQSESKPYESNKELLSEEHEIRSVIIASRFIDLTEEEQSAILHHNGLWGKLDSGFSSTVDKTKLGLLLHFADMWCSRYVEPDKNTVTE